MFYRPKGSARAMYIKSSGEIAREEKNKEARRKAESDAWHSKWITVWRLKKDRLWTDGMITKLLGKPKVQGKYRVFPVTLVIQAESSPEFQAWLAPRLAKATAKNQYFELKMLSTA